LKDKEIIKNRITLTITVAKRKLTKLIVFEAKPRCMIDVFVGIRTIIPVNNPGE